MDKYFKPNDMVNGYRVIKIIGQGRYGIAYLAKNNQGEKCVIKQLKSKMLNVTRDKLFYEEDILKSLDSPRFPKFISRFNDGVREGYLLEYIDGRVYYDLISKYDYVFSRKEIYNTASQLLDLIEILQSSGIVHRDIRLPNVIIMKNSKLALIDFGLARYIDGYYKEKMDYWYIGDFLIHLYYSSYEPVYAEERPWYMELNLTSQERTLLKRLMGLDRRFRSIDEIREQLYSFKSRY